MMVSVSTSSLRRAKWYEYVIRFTLGGLVTAGAGLLAKKFGPEFGGLFLAFPAILAASATLVEKHERERKQEKGLHGVHRGRNAAGADSSGAAMGTLGLMTFAVLAWKFLPNHSAWIILPGSTLVWALVSGAVWWTWKRNSMNRLRLALLRASTKQPRD